VFAASFRPILGIPGSSVLGEPIVLNHVVSKARISDAHSRAIVVTEDGRVGLLDLEVKTPWIEFVQVGEYPDVIAISPSGVQALVAFRSQQTATIVGWSSGQGVKHRELDLSQLDGLPVEAAISDDASTVLIGTLRNSDGAVYVSRDGHDFELLRSVD